MAVSGRGDKIRQMKLISCSACHHKISLDAESCPSCGHPNQAKKTSVEICYDCGDPATTICSQCGVLSCVSHVRSTKILKGSGILCATCEAGVKNDREFQKVCSIIFWIAVVVLLLIASQR